MRVYWFYGVEWFARHYGALLHTLRSMLEFILGGVAGLPLARVVQLLLQVVESVRTVVRRGLEGPGGGLED